MKAHLKAIGLIFMFSKVPGIPHGFSILGGIVAWLTVLSFIIAYSNSLV